jgi:hypothetical protein
MSFAIIGIGAGVATGIGGSLISANSASKAQAGADDTNRQNVLDTNALNKEQFDRSHRNQFALQDQFLPYFQQYGNSYLKDGGSFYDQVASRQSILDQMQPAVDGSRNYITGVFNGDNMGTRMDAAGAVGGERIDAASSQQAAINQALREVASQMAAENARDGYVGGSSFANNRLLASTVGARQSAADAMAQARITNAADAQRITESDLAQRSEYTGRLPGILQDNLRIQDLPASSVFSKLNQVVQPMGYFSNNPSFQYQGQPLVQPDQGAGVGGALMTNAGSAMIDTGLSQLLVNQQNRTPAVQPSIKGSNTTPAGTGSFDWANATFGG